MTEHGFAVALLAAMPLIGMSVVEAAADDKNDPSTSYLRVTAVGDLLTFKTPIPGPLHSNITLGASSADYFRGVFDGVGEDLDEVVGIANLSTTLQPINRSGSGLTALSLTGGTANGLTNGPAADEGDWYESDNFVGVAAQFGGAWTTGLTYTYYATPDISGGDPLQSVAVAGQYSGKNLVGRMVPQLKITKPVDVLEGWFTQASVGPSIKVAKIKAGPVNVGFPVEFGIGWNDYYGGPNGDTGVYGSVGAQVSVPLGLPNSYGSWTATTGVSTLVRDETIQSAGGPLDDAGNVVVSGTVALSVNF